MQNYTEVGFKKLRAPPELWQLISDFWEKNKDNGKPEQWGVGNTYTNNWDSPTTMVSVEDTGLRGGGQGLKQKIWNEAKKVIGAWTGQELTQCSLYGIRVCEYLPVLIGTIRRASALGVQRLQLYYYFLYLMTSFCSLVHFNEITNRPRGLYSGNARGSTPTCQQCDH